jgi:YHS domain-containing protein
MIWRPRVIEGPVEKKAIRLKMAPEPLLVTDPVCGMRIDPATAAGHADYQGTRYYFCNPSCRTRFVADPAKYLGSDLDF